MDWSCKLRTALAHRAIFQNLFDLVSDRKRQGSAGGRLQRIQPCIYEGQTSQSPLDFRTRENSENH
jgi:hypothetical protein